MNSTTNGASRVSTPPTSSTAHVNSPRSQTKMTPIGGKPLDGQRKQTSSPMDQPHRKPSVPNAWAKGSTNPVTQRPAGAMTSNGVTNTQNKPSTAQKVSSTPKESNTPDRHANDRLTYLYAKLIGLPATISLRSGDKYTGIFSSVVYEQSDAKYLLKMVKKIGNTDKQTNGAVDPVDAYVGAGQDHAMTFPLRDVHFHCDNVPAELPKAKSGQNGIAGFKTDTDISNSQGPRERQLQKWEAGPETDVDMSLDGGSKPNGQAWDQFEANQRLYGVTTNYDEAFYTTTIDRSHPEYKQREARAERLAREIESSTAMNAHVAEERGLKLPDDNQDDEESKYSGVARDFQPLPTGQTNKYTPPARRPPAGQTTVPGAPVDPAIISSSLAKPEQPESASHKENEVQAKASLAASKSPKPQEETKAESSKPQLSSLAAKPALPASKLSPAKEGGATATVEKDVVNAFKRFTADEKLKAQEHQRNAIKRDKAVKLNDLKKFALNFKLHTPVPNDLVPILAKDKDKQEKIVEKALKNITEYKPAPPKTQATPSPAPPSSQGTPRATASRGDSSQNAPSNQVERQNQRNRQSQPGFQQSNRTGAGDRSNQPIPTVSRQNQASHGQRLQQQYGPRQQALPIPHNMADPRMPPTGPAMGTAGFQSPPGRVHYNAKIPDFKPNPAAHTFQPGTNNSSGSSPVRASTSKPEQPKRGNFFEGRRGITAPEDRASITTGFNPITRMLQEAKDEGKQKDFGSNGGIPQAYRTPPTWDVAEANKDIKYTQVFEKERMPSASQPQTMAQHHQIPHQHQLPMHLQSGGGPIPTGQTPHHTPRHAPAQPHMGPNGHHFDDHHRMQFSASTSSMHPSPRPVAPYMSFNGQNPQQMQMHHQQMPNYGMSPGGYPIMRQVSSGGHQYMAGPQMGGHVMTNQASQGSYMNMQMNNQMPIFSPGPNQAYPHHSGPPMPQQGGAGNYPSPRPPAPMMAQQGSQQGHHPQMMYMPPGQHGQYSQPPSGPMGQMRPYPTPAPYGTSPHQPHHFPNHPHRGTPSATYVQPMMPTHSMPPAGMPPNGGPPMATDSQEDVK